MQTLNNLANAFHRTGSNRTLLVSLKPDCEMEREINIAERHIRTALGAGLTERLRAKLPPNSIVPRPKFLRQGSRAYDTINDPIRSSTNYCEADSDIGLYLPMEFVKEAAATPKVGADVLRTVVLECLTELAEVHGWKVRAKQCCTRVYIRTDAHIDVTCYAIPEAKYHVMAFEAASNLQKTIDSVAADAVGLESEITWDEIPVAAHLATLTGWIRSDAKAIHFKIQNTYELKGSIFKRIVRFIKALRDHGDDADGPCSIAITLIVADRLDLGLCRLERDDLAVYSMLNIIAEALFKELPTPGNEDVDILADIPVATRIRLANRLRECSEIMRQALYNLPIDRAHAALQGIFGQRFPAAEVSQSSVSVSQSAAAVAAPMATVYKSAKAVAPRGNARSS